jgi:Rrf2 family protein
MCELAGCYGDGNIPLNRVALEHGVSVLFLKKIARVLRQNGLVISREGTGGGYGLARSPDRISLWDIMSSFSKNEEPVFSGKLKSCPIIKNCLPQQVNNVIKNSFRASFSKILLSDLSKKEILK